MILRDCWYMADWAEKLVPGEVLGVTILDEPIALYRKKDGSPSALADRCAHRLAPLSIGRVEGDDVRCLYHGLKFGPDGKCTELPGQAVIPSAVCVPSYPVAERHGALWIWMGEAARADLSLIPAIIGPDEPGWAVLAGTMDFRAHATLIGDNLLDLSHAPWVHQATFASGNEKTIHSMKEGEADTRMDKIERGVFLRRWQLDRPTNPFVEIGHTDDYVVNYFLAPGIFILKNRCFTPGVQMRQGGDRQPDEEPILMRSTCQMITPIDARRSKFFYTFGLWSKHADHVAHAFEVATKAFYEDKFFIEEQQAMMDRCPDVKVMNLNMDAPLLRYRGVLRGLIEAEREQINLS
jgi:vanillate O-demethylase monooxygenase subunit